MSDDQELRGYSIVFGLFAGVLAAGLVAVGLVAQWALLAGRTPDLGIRLASSAAAVVIAVGAQAAILTAFSRGPSLWPSFGLAAIAGIAPAVVSTLRVNRMPAAPTSDGTERA